MALTSEAQSPVAGGERAAVIEVEEQLSMLARTVRASIRQTAAAIDPALSPFGLKILRALARSGPIHSSSVAEFLEVDRSIVSRHAKQLEELGLIELRPDPSDGRCRFLEATDTALVRLEENGAANDSMLHHHLESWSNDDLLQFAGYLRRLGSPRE
jgi:DNA-binding MarR family transcriptional regulator